MKVNIEERKKNPLLDRKVIKGTIDHKDEATPSSESLKGFLSEELEADEESIEVDKIFTIRGMQKSKFWAKELGEVEGTTEEEEGEEKTSSEEEAGEILSGSISDAKDEIEDIENPDYERIMEIEKDNKDRKGMKKYLEKKIGG